MTLEAFFASREQIVRAHLAKATAPHACPPVLRSHDHQPRAPHKSMTDWDRCGCGADKRRSAKTCSVCYRAETRCHCGLRMDRRSAECADCQRRHGTFATQRSA